MVSSLDLGLTTFFLYKKSGSYFTCSRLSFSESISLSPLILMISSLSLPSFVVLILPSWTEYFCILLSCAMYWMSSISVCLFLNSLSSSISRSLFCFFCFSSLVRSVLNYFINFKRFIITIRIYFVSSSRFEKIRFFSSAILLILRLSTAIFFWYSKSMASMSYFL